MRNIRKHILGFGFGLLIMLVVTAFLPPIKNRWLRFSGAVFSPNHSKTFSPVGMPIKILSIKGERWVTSSKLEDAWAYHALVILPAVDIDDSTITSGGGNYNHSYVKKWLVREKEEKELKIIYDAMWQTITVDSQTFYLRNGNLFVISFDGSWKPEVTQFNRTISKTDEVQEHEKLIDAFKSALPEDKIVQQL